MSNFVNLDKVSEDKSKRYFLWEGEKYFMKSISVGTLIKLNKVFQAEEQDLDSMIDVLVSCFPKLDKETCLEFDPEQLGLIAQLVTGSFEEGDDENEGKKDQTD